MALSSSSRSEICPIMASISSLVYSFMSRATWSFRDRPVCRRLPGSPIRSVSSASTKLWMSSASPSIFSFPSSMSARIPSRPATMASASAAGMMPCFPSIRACTMDPRISCLYIRLSKLRDSLKASTSLSVSPVNLPPQSFISSHPPHPDRSDPNHFPLWHPAAHPRLPHHFSLRKCLRPLRPAASSPLSPREV